MKHTTLNVSEDGLAAMNSDRRYVGYEINKDYYKTGEGRLNAFKNQHVLDFGSVAEAKQKYVPTKAKRKTSG